MKKKTKEEISQQDMEEEKEHNFAVEYINGTRLIDPN